MYIQNYLRLATVKTYELIHFPTMILHINQTRKIRKEKAWKYNIIIIIKIDVSYPVQGLEKLLDFLLEHSLNPSLLAEHYSDVSLLRQGTIENFSWDKNYKVNIMNLKFDWTIMKQIIKIKKRKEKKEVWCCAKIEEVTMLCISMENPLNSCFSLSAEPADIR